MNINISNAQGRPKGGRDSGRLYNSFFRNFKMQQWQSYWSRFIYAGYHKRLRDSQSLSYGTPAINTATRDQHDTYRLLRVT